MTNPNAKRRKAIVVQERNVRAYAELWHASAKVLESGTRESKGSAWQFLASIILSAFTFEAYLNHVGPTVLLCWDSLEELPPLAKLDLICEVLKVNLPGSKGERPQQTISTVFRFRNTLAHGRTETITSVPKRLDVGKVDEHLQQRLLTHWEQLIKDQTFAGQAREDIEKVVALIHAARPEPKDYPFTFGLGFGSATVEDD
jgi:hypothetical protein